MDPKTTGLYNSCNYWKISWNLRLLLEILENLLEFG